jgi:NADPH:quinone reductase-like Zn-dependent oxidoreductase
MAQASAVGVAYLAAWSALIEAANLQAGEAVLITGARGAVGQAATQIARWKGAEVIGAGRGGRTSGAEVFVDVAARDLAAEVRALTAGEGVDVVLDCVGGALFEPALRSLRIDGRQVAIASIGARRVEFDLVDFYHENLTLVGVDTMKFAGPRIAAIMDALRAGFDGGHLRPPAVETTPLEGAVGAYLAVEKGGGRARRVLLPHGAE